GGGGRVGPARDPERGRGPSPAGNSGQGSIGSHKNGVGVPQDRVVRRAAARHASHEGTKPYTQVRRNQGSATPAHRRSFEATLPTDMTTLRAAVPALLLAAALSSSLSAQVLDLTVNDVGLAIGDKPSMTGLR